MNLYHLRYFVTLAHLEHYTNAAKVLDITQPSLSHAINAMEEELGIRLFERKGRNVYLTKYGKQFLSEAEEILEHVDSSITKMQMASKGNDTLDVAFLRTLGSRFVPELMREFLDIHAEKEIACRFHCDRSLSADIIEDLKAKKLDVAFCSRIEENPSIEYIPVCREKLVLIVPNGHELTKVEKPSLKEAVNYPHILFRKKSGLSQTIASVYIDNVGKMPEAAYKIEEDAAVAGLVASGFGIAVVPYMEVLEHLPVKVYELEELEDKRLFYLCYLNDVYQPPIVRELISFVSKRCESIPSLL